MAARISERMPHLIVNIRSAHLTTEGIEVHGLSISEPGAPGPQPEIAYVDELLLCCRTSVQELISGEPMISAVRMVRPVLRATRRPDGNFSLARLFPLPKCERPLPPTTIESGSIVVFDPLKNPSSTFTLRDVHLTTRPAASGEPLAVDVQGYLVGDQLQRLEFNGTLNPGTQRWKAAGTIEGLEISPELRDALPEQIAAQLDALGGLRVSAAGSFRATCEGPGQVPQFEVNGRVAHGQLQDPLLPYPVTDLQAELHCDNEALRIQNLTARHGATTWQISEFTRRGYQARSPFVLRASARQVRLDNKWASTLPKPWSNYWQDYDPEGEVNLDCTLEYDGERVKPTLEVTCLDNVSFSFFKFPYRLEGANGKITLQDRTLDVALTAYSDARLDPSEVRTAGRAPHHATAPITLRGRFFNPGPQYTGSIEIRSEKVQFDEKLFSALLKPKARETLRSLNPRGSFSLVCQLWRDDPTRREMHQSAAITLARCSINYDKFPVSLSNLEGVLYLRDGQWITAPNRDIVGTNGTGVVSISGRLTTSADAEVLSLAIAAKNFPLHEELRDALSPNQRQVWYAIQPHGKLDLNADVRYESTGKRIQVALRAFPRDDSTSIGTSIEPVAFPYRMRLLGGSIYYREGHAELENLQLVHGGTKMHAQGACDLSPEGGWQLRLSDLRVDRLRLQGEDHELEAALPEALKRAVLELKPTGAIDVRGAVEFAKQNPNAPLHTGWDVNLFLFQNTIQAGPRLENLFGRVRLTGAADGPRYSSRGELALDSLMYKNFQFTQIHGPLWFDNHNVVLGDWGAATAQAGQPARHVTANLLGGVLSGDCHVKLGAMPHYQLIGTLAQADLGQFAAENLTSHQKLKGKILARVNLQGNGGLRSLVGSGTIHLSDANVYELPVMVSLLKIARAKTPDTTGFTESDIAFNLQGEHLTLNEIQLSGDAVNLSGHGELTLDGQTNPINMQLHTTVGRPDLPILSGMLREASQQIMLINVTGTLDNPIARAEAFPGARGALQQLQVDRENNGGFLKSIGVTR